MRNTLLPILAVVAVLAVGLWLIRPVVDRGQGGPELNPGILRLPARTPIRTASLELAGTTTARLVSGQPGDGTWRVVVVGGEDRSAVTRAVMLALGEALFQAGCVAVIDPVLDASDPTPPLPLPADRVLRVRTLSESVVGGAQGEWQASVELALEEPRLPLGHPAAAWLPPPRGGPAVCQVEHRGRPVAAGGGWPERWAATGRSIAHAAVTALVVPPGIRQASTAAAADWGTPVPFAPQTSELRWAACFQDDFVRGWVGRIAGRSSITTRGARESALEPLHRRLLAGRWSSLPPQGDWRLWNRLRDGMQQWFAVREREDGWEATLWVERPDAAGLVDGWLLAAARGDAVAREHLSRAKLVEALPAAVRQRLR